MANISLTLELPGVNGKLDQIITLLTALLGEEKAMDATTQAKFDALTAAVTAEKTVEQGAVTLLNGLAAEIAGLKASSGTTDPAVIAAVDALVTTVNANAAALAAGVTANAGA